MTERPAMAAERDSTDRYVAAFMQDRSVRRSMRGDRRERFACLAAGRDGRRGAFADVGVLGTEYFRHDERKHALIGDRSGTGLWTRRLVSVRLAEAAPLTAACGSICGSGGASLKTRRLRSSVRAANAADERDCFRPGRQDRPRRVAPQGCARRWCW